MGCYHRPGLLRNKLRTCLHCAVGVEECPCLSWGRTPVGDCPCCLGSGWVAIVCGRIAKFVEAMELWGGVLGEENLQRL
jgi:hypothetical protein